MQGFRRASSGVSARGNRKLRAPWRQRVRDLPSPKAIARATGRGLRRAVPALVTLGVIAGAGAAGWGGYHYVTHSSRFAVDRIDISGAQHVDVELLRKKLPVGLGDNIFSVDMGDVARIVRKEPWVASASVHRELPRRVVIELHERVPVAVVELGGLYLVDASGKPFKRADLGAGDGAGLPIITGFDRERFVTSPDAVAAQAQDALAALHTWQAVPGRPAIGEVHVDAGGDLTLRTYDDATAIQLGPLAAPALASRMATFDAAWNHLSPTEKSSARAIHLDGQPDHVTVAFAKD